MLPQNLNKFPPGVLEISR